jgi:hypothetical protein
MRSDRCAARFGVVGSVVALVTVAFAAVAFACTNLATLNLSSGSGVPGTEITVTGSSFAPAEGASTSPVELHLNDVNGPVLATATPDGAGNIATTFAVPQDVEPGYKVILATQADPEGGPAFGTPARATFQVLSTEGGAAAAPQPAQNAGTTATPSPSNVSPGLLALTIGLGAMGLVLFGAGATAFLRQGRRSEAPVPAKVRSE